MSEEFVAKYYDEIAENEVKRLFKDKYHLLEYIVTMHYINKYFPKSGKILDCGCGPGHYAIALARRGYRVALVDISVRLLEVAKRRFEEEKLEDRIIAIMKTSSTNLSMFPDNYFDAALCSGPLYHLVELSDRIKTVRELWRVLKPLAVIIITAISYFGTLGTVLAKYPEDLVDERFQEALKKGIWRPSKLGIRGTFPDAYFWRPLELKEFLEANGFETLEMAACEGVFTHLRKEVNEVAKDRKKWHRIIELALLTCNDPTIIGNSEHFLWIGRTKK